MKSKANITDSTLYYMQPAHVRMQTFMCCCIQYHTTLKSRKQWCHMASLPEEVAIARDKL